MKINKIKINSFGNIENKEIELSDRINIVYGKNETGKSTLLKFIINTLYGITKTKKGKEYSDYEKYKPWNGGEFSGKISYTLDNGKTYEVFRNFDNNNATVYDEEFKDISKDYSIDRTIGNMFFMQQTNIDEDTFISTMATLQQGVRLSKDDQNVLIQKIANLAIAGDDNVSYKKAIEKINKKQLEDIGNSRSQGRPINIVKDEKFKLQDEIGELEEFKDKKYEIDEIKQNFENTIENDTKKVEVLKQIKQYEGNQIFEKQKIEFSKSIVESNENRIQELKKDKIEKVENIDYIENIKQRIERPVKKDNSTFIILIIMIILSAVEICLRSNKIIVLSILVAFIICIISLLISVKKNKKEERRIQNKVEQEIKKHNDEITQIKNEIDKIDMQIEVLNKNNKEQEDIISKQENEYKEMQEKIKKDILEKYSIDNININNISNDLDNLQDEINNTRLKIHQLELDKNNILPKLDKLAEMEERLDELNEKEKELNRENESIELAKSVLEIANSKMQANVTPRFTMNLSKNIEHITNGKYKNVKINDDNGILIEKENGEYVLINKLSVGTIDQLYLSLRLEAMKEISNENMPIILDEAFAFYDDDRLKNIIKYINDELQDKQIIILSCTDREKAILDCLELDYKCIEL